MFEHKTPYYYSGVGQMLLSKRIDGSGAPEGFIQIGKISKVALVVSETFLLHRESRVKGDVDKAIPQEMKIEITLDVEQLDSDALAFLFRGVSADVASGSGVEYLQVSPGFRYAVDKVGLTSIEFKDSSESVTYENGINYEVDLDTGGFRILADQSGAVNAINFNQAIRVGYSYGDQKEFSGVGIDYSEYRLRMEGLNAAQDETPVVMDFYRVGPQTVAGLTVISEKRQPQQLTSTLLCDNLRPKNDQFFKVKSLN